MEVIVCIADNDQILWLFKLTSQSLQHWRQIGHKKPLSVWCYIGNWNWMLAKLYHCQKHTAALFLNFAKSSSDLIFHESLILSTTTALQCWISVWEENWNGHKVHSPWTYITQFSHRSILVHTAELILHTICLLYFYVHILAAAALWKCSHLNFDSSVEMKTFPTKPSCLVL